MSVYIINNMVIRDRDEYRTYERAFLSTFLKHGGEVLVVHDDPTPLEGEWPYSRTVILRMPSEQKTREWYASPEYQAIAKHRWNSTQSNIVMLPAFQMPVPKASS